MDYEKMDADFLAIKSLFESGIITKMQTLEEQAPTKIAKALGLQYYSYLDKLKEPNKFTFKHIFKIAELCQLNPDLIYNVIKSQYTS
ncbi:hypothetical protein [Sphingobacterium faecale]|uniref:XRE family transcriptional regulator n=1 Tax=Sphingobacterium faecale TaxID=2803775 RepID=A0ABS1R7Y4_9SPHI|nr:hypothetical protein [Sphingobacterium faecale]MBL1410798.1 hypothetical protein [Sphingobacterium faecale]